LYIASHPESLAFRLDALDRRSDLLGHRLGANLTVKPGHRELGEDADRGAPVRGHLHRRLDHGQVGLGRPLHRRLRDRHAQRAQCLSLRAIASR
jgi:hypothetical protein